MGHWYWFVLLPVLWYFLASANDYYNLRVSARVSSSLRRLARITLQLLLVYLAIFFVSPRDALPRLFIVYYAVISLALLGLWRGCRVFLIGWTGFRRRALIVGTGRSADLVREAIAHEANGDYEILGCVASDEETEPEAMPGVPLLGTGARLPELAGKLGVSELILAYVNELPGDIFQGVMTCYERNVAIVPMPLLYEQITRRVPVEHVGEHFWALMLPMEGATLASNLYQMIKRLLDIALALVGLALFAAIFPVLALLIELDSPGPIFFRQERIGRGGVPFTMIKLRTMIPNAEEASGPAWAADNDPRMTRVGRVLRKTRLDEVPQLINVLAGSMSIVGPRPERQVFVDLLAQQIPFYRTRLVVKPGLTGWAQVRYPYGSTTEDALYKLQFDLYYIRHQGLMLDLHIMLRTIGTMLTLGGT
jgi:exopolysaccharide biosynthesis polyprenyl glycosylphosphotransferase